MKNLMISLTAVFFLHFSVILLAENGSNAATSAFARFGIDASDEGGNRSGEKNESPIRLTLGGKTFRALSSDRMADKQVPPDFSLRLDQEVPDSQDQPGTEGDQTPCREDKRRVETAKSAQVPGDRFPRGTITTAVEETTDRQTGLKITRETTTYSDFPEVIEWVAWLENVSDRPTPNIRDLLAADILLKAGVSKKNEKDNETSCETRPILGHGMGENNDPALNYSFQFDPLERDKPLEFAPREGYPSFYAFPYFIVRGASRSFIVAIGWPGQWSASFSSNQNGDVRFRAGQQTVDLYLKPGEKIRTPRITLFSFSPETDETNLWRRWFREYILPREEGRVIAPKLVLDAHRGGELYKDITESQQIADIRKMRAMGFPCDGLWIDAGWYLRENSPKTVVGYWFLTGDWTPDPARFPRGMKPLADELGPNAKLTLWYEPERIHRKSTTFPDYKKYVVPNLEKTESFRMNMASSETVAFLSDLIGRSIRENGVRIYRQDSNGVGPLPFIEQLEKDDPNFQDRKGMAENLYVQGYLTFWKNLQEMNPGLIIDSCASGGRRNDLDTLRMGAVPLHYSDVGYFNFIDKQRNHDLLDRWFIYYKNIDAHDWDGEKNAYDPYKTTIDFSAFSTLRPYIFDHDTPENRRYVERFRAVGEFLVTGDYYLLEGGFRPDSWTVAQYHDAQEGAGFLRVIRNPENKEEKKTVRLKGLRPDVPYQIDGLDYPTAALEKMGRDLMETGLTLTAPPRSGQIIRYTERR